MARFSFMLYSFDKLEKTGPTSYKIPAIEVEAEDAGEAWRIAEPQIPEGFRLFCWFELDKKPQID